LSGWL